MFGLNPTELLIVGFVALLMLGGVVAVVIILVNSQSRSSTPSNPNLTPCPDCGRFVSRLAISCPQCGRPLKAPPTAGSS